MSEFTVFFFQSWFNVVCSCIDVLEGVQCWSMFVFIIVISQLSYFVADCSCITLNLVFNLFERYVIVFWFGAATRITCVLLSAEGKFCGLRATDQ